MKKIYMKDTFIKTGWVYTGIMVENDTSKINWLLTMLYRGSTGSEFKLEDA
jgi:hypothetical protein